MAAYYNEIDTYAAQWLRNLMAANLIPKGEVDERSILDVQPEDIAGFKQVHFFAGIAGWPHALRLAGWEDERKVWSGSCPCQPISCAGQQKAHDDERHLWPAFFNLIAKCKPAIVFGEQVAGTLGREWLSGVRADLESIWICLRGRRFVRCERRRAACQVKTVLGCYPRRAERATTGRTMWQAGWTNGVAVQTLSVGRTLDAFTHPVSNFG